MPQRGLCFCTMADSGPCPRVDEEQQQSPRTQAPPSVSTASPLSAGSASTAVVTAAPVNGSAVAASEAASASQDDNVSAPQPGAVPAPSPVAATAAAKSAPPAAAVAANTSPGSVGGGSQGSGSHAASDGGKSTEEGKSGSNDAQPVSRAGRQGSTRRRLSSTSVSTDASVAGHKATEAHAQYLKVRRAAECASVGNWWVFVCAAAHRVAGGCALQLDEELGSGAFKTVYKAYDKNSGREVAWNEIDSRNLPRAATRRLMSEVRLLQTLNHPRLIDFHTAWVTPTGVVLITELVTSGTLKECVAVASVCGGGRG